MLPWHCQEISHAHMLTAWLQVWEKTLPVSSSTKPLGEGMQPHMDVGVGSLIGSMSPAGTLNGQHEICKPQPHSPKAVRVSAGLCYIPVVGHEVAVCTAGILQPVRTTRLDTAN